MAAYDQTDIFLSSFKPDWDTLHKTRSGWPLKEIIPAEGTRVN